MALKLCWESQTARDLKGEVLASEENRKSCKQGKTAAETKVFQGSGRRPVVAEGKKARERMGKTDSSMFEVSVASPSGRRTEGWMYRSNTWSRDLDQIQACELPACGRYVKPCE